MLVHFNTGYDLLGQVSSVKEKISQDSSG